LPPVRDDLHTTVHDTDLPPAAASTEALDDEWNDS
jgi:hypothetical protein